MTLDCFLRSEHDLSNSRAGRCRKAGGQNFDLLALFNQARNKEVVKLVWLYAMNGFFLRDQAFANHVDSNANCSQSRTLAVAGLQHVELAILNGELKVLHVAVVLFHLPRNVLELFVDPGHRLLELADRQRGADARNHVFALRVHQVLAEEHVLAGCGIAREADAGA